MCTYLVSFKSSPKQKYSTTQIGRLLVLQRVIKVRSAFNVIRLQAVHVLSIMKKKNINSRKFPQQLSKGVRKFELRLQYKKSIVCLFLILYNLVLKFIL